MGGRYRRPDSHQTPLKRRWAEDTVVLCVGARAGRGVGGGWALRVRGKCGTGGGGEELVVHGQLHQCGELASDATASETKGARSTEICMSIDCWNHPPFFSSVLPELVTVGLFWRRNESSQGSILESLVCDFPICFHNTQWLPDRMQYTSTDRQRPSVLFEKLTFIQ